MIVPDESEPQPLLAGWWGHDKIGLLQALHTHVRIEPYRNDLADCWRPDARGDCQGKTAWLIEQLVGQEGWPAASVRGYVATFRPWWARRLPLWLRQTVRSHAFFLVRVTTPAGRIADIIADIRQPRLIEATFNHGYLSMKPAVSWRS